MTLSIHLSLHQFKEIFENHRDSDGADTAGDGGEYRCDFGARGVGVADDLAPLLACTGINERDAFLQMLWLNKSWVPRAEDDNVGIFEIFYRTSFKRKNRHVRSERFQKPRGWCSDEPASADDDRTRAFDLDIVSPEDLNDRERDRCMHRPLTFMNAWIQRIDIFLS